MTRSTPKKCTRIPCSELDDFRGTLGELQSIVRSLISDYGKDATIFFDAGANNVGAVVEVVDD